MDLSKLATIALAAFTATLLVFAFAPHVHCDDDEVVALKTAIVQLQPRVDAMRAFRLAATFAEAGSQNELDPKLLIAMAMRESSLDVKVERLERVGKIGEGGLMQIHGAALRLRPSQCDELLTGAYCQITTGARWLAYARSQCGGSTARWVGAYGLGACPSERMAARHRSVLMARHYYDEIGGSQWTEWTP